MKKVIYQLERFAHASDQVFTTKTLAVFIAIKVYNFSYLSINLLFAVCLIQMAIEWFKYEQPNESKLTAV